MNNSHKNPLNKRVFYFLLTFILETLLMKVLDY